MAKLAELNVHFIDLDDSEQEEFFKKYHHKRSVDLLIIPKNPTKRNKSSKQSTGLTDAEKLAINKLKALGIKVTPAMIKSLREKSPEVITDEEEEDDE